jgi:LysR family nitrogen assimilation transcriptional regulator
LHSKHLEYFCKVVEYGSISRAAIYLGVNQSALSRHIRNLEDELGVQLLYRNGRGAVVTEHGHRLLVRARRALEEIDLAKQEAANARSSGLERLVLGFTPTVARLLVKPVAVELTSMFPAIQLRFVEGFSTELVEALDTNKIDIAVLYEGRDVSRIISESLVTERLSLVTGPGFSGLSEETATTALGEIPLILPSPAHSLRRLVELKCAEHGIKIQVRAEADSLESILGLVKADLGATILPRAAVIEEIARGELRSSELVGPAVTRTMALATPTNHPPVSNISIVTRLISNILRESNKRSEKP